MKKLILIGAGGHARVIADIAIKSGYEIIGFLDDAVVSTEDYPVLGRLEEAGNFGDGCDYVIGIGSNAFRRKFAESHPLPYAILIHPSAQIGRNVRIGEGTVVMPNAVINANAQIGRHCIINSAAVVEHDNQLHDYVHVSPGAVLCGTVSVGAGTHIGAGAIIKNNVSVCADCVIGIGCAVVESIAEIGTYIGVPAKKMKRSGYNE